MLKPFVVLAAVMASCSLPEPAPTDDFAIPTFAPTANVLYTRVADPYCAKPLELAAQLADRGFAAAEPIEFYGPAHAAAAPVLVGFIQEWADADGHIALVRGDPVQACIIARAEVKAL